ncbi:MAG: hypothetical protein K0R66_932 [Gammaproteobacteria bacterium]|jgi:heme-degrading monooxygenase HmoA|nr:hypothetical protein [Gammaproteobacteria bacterium]
MSCVELVIYEVKAEAVGQFIHSQAAVVEDLKKQAGFIEYCSYRSSNNPLCFSDKVTWADKESAIKAFEHFKTLPSAPRFMQCIDKVLFSEHFELTVSTKAS